MGHNITIYMLLGSMSEQQSMGLPLAYFALYLIQLPNSKPTVKDNMTFPVPIYSKWKNYWAHALNVNEALNSIMHFIFKAPLNCAIIFSS